MSDDALIAWLTDGALPSLSEEEAAARRAADFSRRFAEALSAEDQGTTQELHDAAVAQLVYAVHLDLCRHGIEDYDAVWKTLAAPMRASIKRCIELAKG